MPTMEVNFEVFCECGNGLCNQTSVDDRTRRISLTVEPCRICIDKAKEEGFEDGKKEER